MGGIFVARARNVFRIPKRREEELTDILKESGFRVVWREGADEIVPRRVPVNYPRIDSWKTNPPVPVAYIYPAYADISKRVTLQINQNYSGFPREIEHIKSELAPYQARVRAIVEDFLHQR